MAWYPAQLDANARYSKQPETLNNKVHYATADGNHHIYCDEEREHWAIDPDTDNTYMNGAWRVPTVCVRVCCCYTEGLRTGPRQVTCKAQTCHR